MGEHKYLWELEGIKKVGNEFQSFGILHQNRLNCHFRN